MPNIEIIENVLSVSNGNYTSNLSESTESGKENFEKKVADDKHKFTPFTSYSDSKNLNDLSWQTTNQYRGLDKVHTFNICCKEFKLQNATYEKYQILKMFLKVYNYLLLINSLNIGSNLNIKPFLVIIILLTLLIVMFRIDVFLPVGGPSNGGDNDPDSAGPTR
jgi:hypothetical protein